MSLRDVLDFGAIALAFVPITYLLWPRTRPVRIRIEEAKERGIIAEWDVLRIIAVNRTAPVDVTAFHLLWHGGRLDGVGQADSMVRLENHEPIYFTVECATLAQRLRERGCSGTVSLVAELKDTRGRSHRSKLFPFDIAREWIGGSDARPAHGGEPSPAG